MKKIRIFIDYPVSETKVFQGLSFPQVLYDFLKDQDDIQLVGENDVFDILLVTNGGSQYTHFNTAASPTMIAKLTQCFKLFNRFRKMHYNRYLRPNLYYQRRIENFLARNPQTKIVHRLDDRYRMLCKVYGYDETVAWINKRANATIFQTEYCKRLYTKGVKTIFGFEEPIPINNGVIIYNGVDRDVFHEQGEKKSLTGKYKIFHVATTGMTRKGLGRVLEFAYLLRNNNDIQFYLVGRQEQDPVYGREIKKFSNVHAFGHTNDRFKLASYYRSGDVLLYPTVNDCSPNVVLEAMSCGMPVVASNSGGTPELLLKDDISGGILIDEINPIYALKEILDHLDVFKNRCVALVKTYHTKEIMGAKYLQLFRSLLNL